MCTLGLFGTVEAVSIVVSTSSVSAPPSCEVYDVSSFISLASESPSSEGREASSFPSYDPSRQSVLVGALDKLFSCRGGASVTLSMDTFLWSPSWSTVTVCELADTARYGPFFL